MHTGHAPNHVLAISFMYLQLSVTAFKACTYNCVLHIKFIRNEYLPKGYLL